MSVLARARQRVSAFALGKRARAVRRDHLTYLVPSKLRRIERSLRRIDRDGVSGDVCEFGVALGGSAILLATLMRSDRRFLGFDVFAMIPPPQSEKDDDHSRERYEVIRSGQAKGIGGSADYYGYRKDLYSDVVASFARHSVPVDGQRVQLHKGLFEDSWPLAAPASVALAHIDCDWYDPVRYCLAAVADRMPVGGRIVLDDYHDYGGAKRATDEFLAERRDFVMHDGPNPILRRIA